MTGESQVQCMEMRVTLKVMLSLTQSTQVDKLLCTIYHIADLPIPASCQLRQCVQVVPMV
jgi:hypothetical protein